MHNYLHNKKFRIKCQLINSWYTRDYEPHHGFKLILFVYNCKSIIYICNLQSTKLGHPKKTNLLTYATYLKNWIAMFGFGKGIQIISHWIVMPRILVDLFRTIDKWCLLAKSFQGLTFFEFTIECVVHST